MEVIGEAVKHIPEWVRKNSSQVDWKKIAGLRDILIHQYFGVDVGIIWDVVQNKLTPLEQAVKGLE